MKYRLLDIIRCPSCSDRLHLTVSKAVKEQSNIPWAVKFHCENYCGYLIRENCKPEADKCQECYQVDIVSGTLSCKRCGSVYSIKEGVPGFVVAPLSKIKETDKTYSLLWNEEGLPDCHYEKMQEVIPEKIVTGKIGLEVGCGSGVDVKAMAEKYPDTEIVTFDISDGVYTASRLTKRLANVHVLRASALKLPFRNKVFDFCYSFGVIHHTPDPNKCFSEISKVLKNDGKAFFYLYDDHSDNVWKKYPLKVVTVIRKVSSKLDKRILYFISIAASPFVFMLFTIPAKVLRYFPATKRLSDYIPFNFGNGPFSLWGDIYDRFGAPIEFRFNKKTLGALLEKNGFSDIQFTKLKTSAGIVSWSKR